MVLVTWSQIALWPLTTPGALLRVPAGLNVPRATCGVLAWTCGRRLSSMVSTGLLEPTKVISSADVKDVLCAGLPTTLLFLREFLVGTATSRRKALLGVAAPVVGCILRLRGTKRLTASEVVEAFKDTTTTTTTTTKKKNNNTKEMMRFFDDATLVNAYSILVLAASVLPEDLRDVTFLPTGGPVVRVFSEKYAFDVEVVRLPKMNVPKIGNFLVFDVYSSQNETLFGGRGQGFRYNVFLTPRYVVFDVPVFAYKQFKKSKLAKAKCIVKSQKFGFELDLIETLNPFTVPQRLFFGTTKVIGKVSDVVIAKPAKIARRQFVRTVLRREPREPRQLTFLERVQVLFGVLDPEDIENEASESPRSSLLPFSKPEPPNSKSASKNSSTRGSKANSKAASGRNTPKRKENDIKSSDASTPDVTQLLPRLKSFSEIKEDVDTFFQGTPEEQAARKKSEEEAKKKFEREQKKKQKELAQKRDREMKEQKKKAQEEEKAKLKKLQEQEEERRLRNEKRLAEAEADGRRMVEMNDSYFNRYVPDVADAIIKAPTAVESPSKK